MIWLVVVLLLWAAGSSCVMLYNVLRAREKHRLLANAHGITSDIPGGIGISVLCSGVTDRAQIENLLTVVEYSRYEVIVVIDAQRHPAAFEALAARYRMIRVEWTPLPELPVRGVRSLGRSRSRCYRRLVLVDRAQDVAEGDFDAAAAVASYDYVIPVRAGQYLLPGAVERLVAELGEEPVGVLEMVRWRVGVQGVLLARDVVVGAGGFRRYPMWCALCKRRRMLWEPILRAANPRRVPRYLWVAGAVLLGAAIVLAVWTGRWLPAAVLMTTAWVWAAAGCTAQTVREMSAEPSVGDGDCGDVHQNLKMKNFTVS